MSWMDGVQWTPDAPLLLPELRTNELGSAARRRRTWPNTFATSAATWSRDLRRQPWW